MDERLPPPPPQFQLVSPASMSAPASPYSALHPLLLPSPNPHLLLKPKTLTLSLSSSSLASMPSSSSPPAPAASDAWELVQPTVTVAAAAPVDGGVDDCAIFPPRLHEGLGLEGEEEEAAAKEEEEEETDDEEEEWIWGWGRWRAAARRAWAAGAEGVLVHGECGCPGVRPAVWSAAAAAVVVGALLYMRRRDRRERDLLVLLSQEKDKRIAQLLHQIALLSDIRSGSEAIKMHYAMKVPSSLSWHTQVVPHKIRISYPFGRLRSLAPCFVRSVGGRSHLTPGGPRQLYQIFIRPDFFSSRLLSGLQLQPLIGIRSGASQNYPSSSKSGFG